MQDYHVNDIAAAIINGVVSEAEGVKESGFPLHAFPQAMQGIVLDWAQDEGYVKEYAAMAMLSAIATALGNALHIRIRGEWVSNAAMYCILVGRPGLGKTPPLEAAFAPIRKHDAELMRQYCKELELYEAASSGKDKSSNSPKPTLVQYIVNDFTPEAMFEAHHSNQRGIVILVDEIIGMFNSVNRYTSGPLIEQLLSAWSGTPISIIRKSNPKPLHIGHPCISIIGTIQTTVVGQLFKKGYSDNGLLDRIIFIYPKSSRIKRWTKKPQPVLSSEKKDATQRWASVIDKVLSLAMPTSEDGTIQSKVLEFDEAGQNRYYDWWNSCVDAVNNVENDAEIETRTMKRNTIVARLALLFQVAKWACGEGHIQFVDEDSVKSAIALDEYIEECYSRVKEIVAISNPVTMQQAMLDTLGGTFTTKDALEYAKVVSVTERTVKNWLKKMVEQKILLHDSHGSYRMAEHLHDVTIPNNSETEDSQFHISLSSFSSLSEGEASAGKCKSEENEK